MALQIGERVVNTLELVEKYLRDNDEKFMMVKESVNKQMNKGSLTTADANAYQLHMLTGIYNMCSMQATLLARICAILENHDN